MHGMYKETVRWRQSGFKHVHVSVLFRNLILGHINRSLFSLYIVFICHDFLKVLAQWHRQESRVSRGRGLVLPVSTDGKLTFLHFKSCFHFWAPHFNKDIEVLKNVQRRAIEWWRVWSTSLARSGCGSWRCLGWKKGGSGTSYCFW